jgi:16S rRNA (cytosine967-C5)-methyltransferase
LEEENEAQVAAFLGRHTGWAGKTQKRFTPLSGGDGFFLATLTRSDSTLP